MKKKTGFSLIQVIITAGLVGIVIVGGFFLVDRNSTLDIAEPEESNLPTEKKTYDSSILAVPAPGFEDVPEMIVNDSSDRDENAEDESTPQTTPQPRAENPDFVIPPESSEESGDYQVTEVIVPPIEATGVVQWNKGQNGWKPTGTPPACPDPLRLAMPVNLSLATSILYPGQYRGNQYKPHGGFRFDNSKSNAITVTSPMDAQVVDGGRYLVDGEIQYTFDFINSCGMWYRFGHLRELSPKFATLAETFPKAKEGDSRTYGVSGVSVTVGEVIATAVGLANDDNVFVDWGVYDLRAKNSASEDSSWAKKHPNDQEQHAVCWFDLLSSSDEGVVKNLPPSDGISGKTSDYCI